MIACAFDEETTVLDPPSGIENCDPLPVRVVQETREMPPLLISCWKLTKEELEEVNKTGRVWLAVCGRAMPPVVLSGFKFN